jgi:hypothetical protein
MGTLQTWGEAKMNISIVGIDLAKNVFQVCALSVDGTIAWNRKISRAKLSGVRE